MKHYDLIENIQNLLNDIPKGKNEYTFKGAYERPKKYVAKNKTRKIKKIINFYKY